jgi:sigma-B regulation protein RsbU (phosphoserine phosphatase)
MFVTVFAGILTISTGRFTFVNAGHCRPIICKKDGQCIYEEHYGGFVLAGAKGEIYTPSVLTMEPGDTLLLYTDGVTEATSANQELYGEERLLQFARENNGLPPREMIEGLWERVEDWQKDAEQFDDVTMLALTYRGNGFVTRTAKANMENIRPITDFIEKTLTERGVCKNTTGSILMAADELLSNICYYSGAKEMTVGIKVAQTVILYVEDDGYPYNPLEEPDPDVEQLWDQGGAGGFGIYLVKQFMEEVKYVYVNGRNRLMISKER